MVQPGTRARTALKSSSANSTASNILWGDTVPLKRVSGTVSLCLSRFFSAVWFHEPHTRIASPPDLVAKYEKRGFKKKQATYYANIENVDIVQTMTKVSALQLQLEATYMVTAQMANVTLINFLR